MKRIQAIPEKMHALVLHAPHDLRYEEVQVPQINEDEILVRVKSCGICAGDLKAVHGAAMFWGGGVLPKWIDEPVILGPEVVGEVVAIGDAAAKRTGLELGDLSIAEQIIPCGECYFCKRGYTWMCEKQNIYGAKKNESDGGMAEYMKYPKNAVVHKVPASIPAWQAAMIEPASCAAHTIERADIGINDVVVIAGLGPIGLCKLQFAKMRTPKTLIAIDLNNKRLELARKLGADYTFNPKEMDVIQAVKDLTGGYGCDIYIHDSGSPAGVRQGLQMLRKLGKFVEFSVFADETSVDWSIIGDRKELTILGSHISGHDGYEVAIRSIADGSLKVDDIVTHRYGLEAFEEAYRTAEAAVDSIKIVFEP